MSSGAMVRSMFLSYDHSPGLIPPLWGIGSRWRLKLSLCKTRPPATSSRPRQPGSFLGSKTFFGVEISKKVITDLDQMLPRIIQIVDDLVQSGGMETYVAACPRVVRAGMLGFSIICEQVMAEASHEIDVIQVENCREKRRCSRCLLLGPGWTRS